MLDEQFFGNTEFHNYLTSNFINIHLIRGTETGDKLFKKYSVNATPTVLIANADGTEIDRVIGYGPPAADFVNTLEEAYKGVETIAILKKAYDKNPNNVLAAFKLGKKYNDNYQRLEAGKILKIVSENKQAKEIYVPYKDTNKKASLYEYALFMQNKLDDFIEKCEDSDILEDAYLGLARKYSRSRNAKKAVEFFEKMLEKYPDNIDMLKSFVNYTVVAEQNITKGLEAAEKVDDAPGMQEPDFYKNHAILLDMSGETDEVNKVYGDNYASYKTYLAASDFMNYAEFWLKKGENEEDAIVKAKLAGELYPYFISRAAQAFVDNNKVDLALDYYGPKFIKDKKSDDRALSTYAMFWSKNKNNLKSALKVAKDLLKEDKSDANYHTIASVYFAMDKLNDALKAEEEAIAFSKRPSRRYNQQLKKIKDAIKAKSK